VQHGRAAIACARRSHNGIEQPREHERERSSSRWATQFECDASKGSTFRAGAIGPVFAARQALPADAVLPQLSPRDRRPAAPPARPACADPTVR
jgi:hypothetical protein